jgi:hypothetical protein
MRGRTRRHRPCGSCIDELNRCADLPTALARPGLIAAAAAVVGVLVGLALVGFDVVPGGPRQALPSPSQADSGPSSGCPADDQIALIVATAPEIAPALRRIAGDAGAGGDLRCVGLAATGGAGDLVDADAPSIAISPSVIAMPQPMADVLGWPDAPMSWESIATLAAADDAWAEHRWEAVQARAAGGHPRRLHRRAGRWRRRLT